MKKRNFNTLDSNEGLLENLLEGDINNLVLTLSVMTSEEKIYLLREIGSKFELNSGLLKQSPNEGKNLYSILPIGQICELVYTSFFKDIDAGFNLLRENNTVEIVRCNNLCSYDVIIKDIETQKETIHPKLSLEQLYKLSINSKGGIEGAKILLDEALDKASAINEILQNPIFTPDICESLTEEIGSIRRKLIHTIESTYGLDSLGRSNIGVLEGDKGWKLKFIDGTKYVRIVDILGNPVNLDITGEYTIITGRENGTLIGYDSILSMDSETIATKSGSHTILRYIDETDEKNLITWEYYHNTINPHMYEIASNILRQGHKGKLVKASTLGKGKYVLSSDKEIDIIFDGEGNRC